MHVDWDLGVNKGVFTKGEGGWVVAQILLRSLV